MTQDSECGLCEPWPIGTKAPNAPRFVRWAPRSFHISFTDHYTCKACGGAGKRPAPKPSCQCVCRECAEGDHCGEGKQEGLGDCMYPLKDRTNEYRAPRVDQ